MEEEKNQANQKHRNYKSFYIKKEKKEIKVRIIRDIWTIFEK